jgi:gliding motility-associated-like protein
MIMLSLHGAVLTGQADTICFNDTILYAIPGTENSAYNWIISGGTIIYYSTRKDSVIVVWNESTGLHSVEVTERNENYCTSEPEVLEVFVYKPSVNLGGDVEICEGSSEVLVVEPDYEEYFWNNQPGTNEFVVSTAGIISLEVIDKYGCRATDNLTVTVNENPEPDFIVDIDTLNRSVSAFNLSDSTWQYQWNFGDSTFSDDYNPGIHYYSSYGSYEITLNASANGCSGMTSVVVNITDPIKADFMAVYEGCAPVEVAFINLSTGADTYYWDFGNGNSSSDENPTTIYSEPGIYGVTLYAKKDTAIRISKTTITVNEAPVADFEVNPAETNRFEEIQFINRSSNAVNYVWNFGDGESSELYEPTHSYASSGIYDVTLSVWSEAGCTDSLMINNAITITQDCRILFPTGFIPNKNGPSGGYYNPAQKVDNNEIFHPICEKIDEYELRIYNRWGELVFISRDIDIGWDGYYNGKLAPQDTYMYEAKSKCSSGEEIATIGSVTLIY